MLRLHSKLVVLLVASGLALGTGASARADETSGGYVDFEIPTLVLDRHLAGREADSDAELDLANIVQSATRGVTTVQEAPAIVTVVVEDEIADRQFTSLEQIIDTVPGWMRLGGLHNQFPLPLARGQPQAALFLHDGVSMFDPLINVPAADRVQPVETIKRVELITGPGGVLWGANALLGIINVITKDADDVDGVEANVTVGGGNGDRDVFRAYVMAGAPDLLGGKVKAFFHASYESFLGPGFEMPIHLLSTSLPQPNSTDLYGPLTRGQPQRSQIIDLSGKLTLGKLRLRVQFPFEERHTPLTFDGGIVREHIPQDTAVDPDTGMPLCPVEPPFSDPGDACADKGRLNRDHRLEFVDRYGVAEYQSRSDSGSQGISAKAYVVDFLRRIGPFSGGAALRGLLEGGISFTAPIEGYRAGAAVDGDASLPHEVRLLYGIEAFHEWQRDVEYGSRQGEGVQTRFDAPVDLSLLPLPCPHTLDAEGNEVFVEGCPLTMAFPARRTVFGAYFDSQWRPTPKLILDAGARLQVSPAALGKQSYAPTPTFGGALVYRLAQSWNLKLNVAQGFRPPIFNNTTSNGEAIQIDGAEDLEVETSTAGQVELNARLFKGDRRIRELTFRADYSYTALQNLIQIVGGSYENTADRGIHSAELLGKLYLQGGHRLELGYTWLKVLTEDVGLHRSLPEHWLNLGAVFAFSRKVSATTTLRVIGSMEDPNRMVDSRNYTYDELGNVVRRDTMLPEYVSSTPSQLVLDHLPPVADLTLGLSWLPTAQLLIRATVHNAFNERYYQPDAFFSYEPRIEFLPNPAEDVRAYVSATYQY